MLVTPKVRKRETTLLDSRVYPVVLGVMLWVKGQAALWAFKITLS